MRLQNYIMKKKDLVSGTVENKTFIIDLKKKNVVYELNRAGSFIWGLINDKKSIPDLVDGVKKEFGIGEKKAEADVKQFISTLKKSKLVISK